ncbi:hypothetical protein [Maribacter forsetii]|uniref:hypothetical protein n=1 Tax=Maribacter forsetii TaxID=444515 RepID=UPI0012F925C1|nr:hypothetical protein [Maribacter forsetii]
MKTNIVVILALTAILTSCSSTKNTTSVTNETSTDLTETTSGKTSGSTESNSTTMTQNNIASQVNGSTGAMSNTGVQNTSQSIKSKNATMFSKLEMSDDQISTYNAAMSRFKNKQANTASGEMLGSIESERTRQLENILSSSQYAKYEQWLIDNQ